MTPEIEGCDFWWFRELYSTLVAFADEPESSINLIGGGISIPDDLANDLDHFRRCVLAKYPAAADTSLMRIVEAFDAIFTRYSRKGVEFNEWFWTDEGFARHPEWMRIREQARAFLLH